MADESFISYLRVSTAKQGTSGLGLEAQRESVAGFLNGGEWKLIQEVVEVESGKRNDRPALATALRLSVLRTGRGGTELRFYLHQVVPRLVPSPQGI